MCDHRLTNELLINLINRLEKPPIVTAIIVMSEEEAERLAAKIPDSVIVGKVRDHIKKNPATLPKFHIE